MKKLTTATAITTAIFFSSCASKFSPEQQAQLTTLNVSTPSYGQDAYKNPIGSADMNNSTAIMAAGGGIAGALVGQLVVGGIAANQRSGFNKQYGDVAEDAKKSIPQNLATSLEKSNESAINSIPQFRGKIKNFSTNELKTEIVSYGYKRVGKSDSKILMTPYINGKITFTINGSKVINSIPISAQAHGTNAGGHEITNYLTNKSLAHSDFTTTCEKFSANVKTLIESKFK